MGSGDGSSGDRQAGSRGVDLLGKALQCLGDHGDYERDQLAVKGLPSHGVVRFGELERRLGAQKEHQ